MAVGGDGTISEVANGYMKFQGKERGVAFAILPFGLILILFNSIFCELFKNYKFLIK